MAIRRFSTSNLSGGKSSKLWDQETTPGYFESIATVILASNTSAVDFNNIPSTYTHLQVRFMLKSQSSGNDFSVGVNGGFSTTNCSNHIIYGNGSTATANASSSQTGNSLTGIGVFSLFPSNSVGSGIMDILDYQNTNKTKVFRVLWGSDQNGAGFVALNSGNINTTSAITSLNFYNGYNWAAGSHFALYGIRGA